jgi:GWxTD domain-containing protein
MNGLQTALGWALFHSLWQGAAIAAALAASLWFARNSRVRYLCACGALLSMLLSFAITLALCWPADPHFHAIAAGPLPALRLAPVPPLDGASSLDGLRESGPPSWLVPVWMGGVSLFYCYSLVAWMAATRLKKRGAFPAPIEWQHRLAELAARLGLRRPVALLESCLTEVPVVIGYLRPVILMPVGVLAGLTTEQVEAILIHELAHIRRYDYLVNVMQTLVEGMLFYHPAVWWAGSVMRTEREHCCDDAVVAQQGDACGYAATLARLELNRGAVREPLLAATGGNLMRRIHRLMQQPEGPRVTAPLVAAGMLIATATLALAAWQAQPQPQPQRQQTQPQVQPQPQAQLQPQTAPVQTPQHLVEPLPQPMIAPVTQPVQQTDPRPLTPRQQMARENKLRQELETPYRKWLNEDVAYIITDEERTAFKVLQTDAEREKFIEQFWTRRDPTPGTVENEMKEEHYRRIAYSNEHYAAGIPGWKTDRGRIYITYGPPDEIEDHPTTSTATAYQQWRYKWIAGVGNNVIVEFIDPQGTNEYRMTMDPQEKTASNTLPITANVIPPTGQIDEVSRRVNVTIPIQQGRTTRVRGVIYLANVGRQANAAPAANLMDISEGISNSYLATFMLKPGAYIIHFTTTDIRTGASRQGEIPLTVY